MSMKYNIIKGWITSIFGIALMIISIILWFTGTIPLIWEGAVGIILGTILLFSPRTIEKKVSEFVSSWGGQQRGGGYYGPQIHINEAKTKRKERSIQDEPLDENI